LIAPIISCEIRSKNEYKENAEGIFLHYVKQHKQPEQKHHHREMRGSRKGFKVSSIMQYDILSVSK